MKCLCLPCFWYSSAVIFAIAIYIVNGAAYVALLQADDNAETFLQRNSRDVFGSGEEVPEEDDNIRIPDFKHFGGPQVLKFHVQSSITGRYANTIVTSKLHNWENYSMEATFPLTLPEEAFISDFFMIVGGIVYRSEVAEKKEAQRKYDKAKEKGQTAGQVKQKSPEANEFGISVNVAANTSVIFNLTYEQLLNRKHGIIEHRISSRPRQLVDDYKVDIYLTETQGISILEAGWQLKGLQNVDWGVEDVTMDRQSVYRAHVKFQPSRSLQFRTMQTSGVISGFGGDVVLRYDVNHDLSAGELQVMNGYFVHYFSPVGLPPARKSVAFVIDVSGSMSGEGKLDYTKDALRTILGDMREGDRFNIITFESDVRTWKETMLDVTPQNIEKALQYVDSLRPLYNTNLHGGIMAGIQTLRTQSGNDTFYDTYPMIIMLTDGLPSAGVTALSDIRRLVKDEIRGEMSLFTLGFGEDVDSTLLEQLALENQGVYRKIYVDSSASLQLKGFYDEVATPLLYNIDISYTNNAIDVDSITQTNFISYFEGTELVVAGKLNNEIDVDVLSASVMASSRLDNELEMTVSANTNEPPRVLLNRHVVDDFAQRLWAYKTIKLLLDQLKIANTEEEKADIKDRALELSLKYRFVTPLTSLIVVKPEDEKEQEVTAAPTVPPTALPTVAGSQPQHPSSKRIPSRGSNRGGGGGGGGRGGGGGGGGGYADSDPHFVVHIPANDLSICFDIGGNHGDVFDLLTDEELGISVHGSIVSTGKSAPGRKHTRTYFGSILIHLNGHNILLSPSNITIDDAFTLSWEKTTSVSVQNFTVSVQHKKRVEVYNDEGVNLVFVLHKVKDNHEFKVDHLGFYVDQGEGFSTGVHGLIGQFQYKSIPVVRGSIQISNRLMVTAHLSVDEKQVKVLKRIRQNSMTKTHQPCWFVRDNGQGLLEGHYTDYLVN